jgi:hypothetical protein
VSDTRLIVSWDQGIALPPVSERSGRLEFDPGFFWSIRSTGLFRSANAPMGMEGSVSDGVFEYQITEMLDATRIRSIEISALQDIGWEDWVWYTHHSTSDQAMRYQIISPPDLGEKLFFNSK